MIKIVGVRFRNAGKVYYFDPKEFTLSVGEHVIVETSKGPEFGVISTGCKMVADDQVAQPLRGVLRIASGEDEALLAEIRIKEKEALKVCRAKVREHELDMKVVGAEYAFDGSKMLFYFTADGRVDFRELVKDLAGVFHMRIELRQIGVRDETRMLGGIGTCGRELCCATYLREFQPVSIKMAKEQNLSLNPTKISGTCGRLMCCLKNEEETYEFLNAKMPKMGAEAITSEGRSGKVVELDVLRQRVRVLFEEDDTKELEYFHVEELTFQPRKKKDPSAQGQEKARGRKADKSAHKGDGAEQKAEKKEHAEKPAKDSVREGAAEESGSPEAGAEQAERKKKPRRKKHRAEGNAPASDAEGRKREKSGEEPAAKSAEAGAAKKRRRHRTRHQGAEHRDGAAGAAAKSPDQPGHTSEMKIYADRGAQSD